MTELCSSRKHSVWLATILNGLKIIFYMIESIVFISQFQKSKGKIYVVLLKGQKWITERDVRFTAVYIFGYTDSNDYR